MWVFYSLMTGKKKLQKVLPLSWTLWFWMINELRLNRLPSHIQMILSCFDSTPLYGLCILVFAILAPPSGQKHNNKNWPKSGEPVDVSLLSKWKLSVCPSPTDHLVSWCQEHCLGVIWWQEETRNPVWRLVNVLHHQLLFHCSFFFISVR